MLMLVGFRHVVRVVGVCGRGVPVFEQFDFHEIGFGASQRYFIPHQGIFHRVLKRSVEYDTDLAPPDESHLHDPLPESSVPEYFCYDAGLSRLKI